MKFFKGTPYTDKYSLILINLNKIAKDGIREIAKGSEIKFQNSDIKIKVRDSRNYLESTIENFEYSNNLYFYNTEDSNIPFVCFSLEDFPS